MAKRECSKSGIIKEISKAVAEKLRVMPEGSSTSISMVVSQILKSRGYESIYVDLNHGRVWTKDKGVTYAIQDFDKIDVLYEVEKFLKNEIVLDFSEYDGMDVGLPYNIRFIVKKCPTP